MITKFSPAHDPGCRSKILLQPLLLQKRVNTLFLVCWLNQNVTKTSFNLSYLFLLFLCKNYKMFFKHQNALFHLIYFWSYSGNCKTEIFFPDMDWNAPFAWQSTVISSCKNCAFLSYICQYDFLKIFLLTYKYFFFSALHGRQICLQCFSVMNSALSYVIHSWINVIPIYFK